MDSNTKALQDKFRALEPILDERSRRLWAAVEARALGRGGISAVSRATGLSRTTVRSGLRELGEDGTVKPRASVRQPGGGRKSLEARDPDLVDALQRKLDPVTRGDPQSALRWTCRSAAHLAAELRAEGHTVSERSVNRCCMASATACSPIARPWKAASTRIATRNSSISAGAWPSFSPRASR